MNTFHYPILCQACGCPAEYKVAARWSDGLTYELKTYGLVCAECLPGAFAAANAKPAAHGLAPEETLDLPGIYRLASPVRDHLLERQVDLETRLTAAI